MGGSSALPGDPMMQAGSAYGATNAYGAPSSGAGGGYATWSDVKDRRNSFNGGDPYNTHSLHRRRSFNGAEGYAGSMGGGSAYGGAAPYAAGGMGSQYGAPGTSPYAAGGGAAPYAAGGTSPYMGSGAHSSYSGPVYEPHSWTSYLAQQGIPYSNTPYRSASPMPGYGNMGSAYGGSAYGGSSALIIHPYINADVPRPDFIFDLGIAAFSPQRYMQTYGGTGVMTLSTEELQEFAAHPPLARLRIVHESLPLWPIDLEYNASPELSGSSMSMGGNAPPITLGDVLVVLHQRLHERITPMEWSSIDQNHQYHVAKAYSRRCRNEERIMPGSEPRQRADGVKRVDFLLGRSRLVGLKMISEMERGVVTMTLVTS